MKAAKRLPVNFEEQEDELFAQPIEIKFKSARAQGNASREFNALNLPIKMPPAVWLTASRRVIGDQSGRSKAALRHGEPGHSRLLQVK